MAYLFGALLCLGLSVFPIGMLMLLSIGASRADSYISWFSFSVGAVAIGLLLCVRGWKASRTLAGLLGILLLGPGVLSSLLLWEGLSESAHTNDVVVCMRAQSDGGPIPRGDKRYRKRLDNDGNGLACELYQPGATWGMK